MTEDFEKAAERRIVDLTDELLNSLDRLAVVYDVDAKTVEQACQKFFGPDLAECWVDYVAEAEL